MRLFSSAVETLKLDESSGDYNTTAEEFNNTKKQILAHLRRKGDPVPSLVQPGRLCEELAFRAAGRRLRALQLTGEQATIVRGFKLVSIGGVGGPLSILSYNATPHVVVRRENGALESFARNRDPSNKRPFVFVPSSRMHSDLSDAELLRGHHMLCTIVGGSKDVVEVLLLMRESLSEFEKRKICLNTDTAMARRMIITRTFPFYKEWSSGASGYRKLPADLLTDSQLAFGFPYRELREDEAEHVLRNSESGANAEIELDEPLADDFVRPSAPWRFDSSVWLPAVRRLHHIYENVILRDAIPFQASRPLFLSVYTELQEEYCTRIATGETPSSLPRREGPDVLYR